MIFAYLSTKIPVAAVCADKSFCWPEFAFFLHPFSLPLEELIAQRHAVSQ